VGSVQYVPEKLVNLLHLFGLSTLQQMRVRVSCKLMFPSLSWSAFMDTPAASISDV